jgi:hypothetical protein
VAYYEATERFLNSRCPLIHSLPFLPPLCKTAKVFTAPGRMAAMRYHVLDSGEQMVQHYEFCNTIGDCSSTGNPYFNSKLKPVYL